MIDLHTHLLPNVDDGSKSIEETAQMLRASYEQGVEAVIATPHFYAFRDKPDEFLARRKAAFESIEHDPATMPQILLGAEVCFFDGISRSDITYDLTIGDSNVILIEMPFTIWSARIVDEVCALKNHCGLQPILAHVERYRDLEFFYEYMNVFLHSGILFQCNSEFFIERSTRRLAKKFIKRDYFHFIATDCHDMIVRPPNIAEAVKVINKIAGPGQISYMNEIANDLFGLNLSI